MKEEQSFLSRASNGLNENQKILEVTEDESA